MPPKAFGLTGTRTTGKAGQDFVLPSPSMYWSLASRLSCAEIILIRICVKGKLCEDLGHSSFPDASAMQARLRFLKKALKKQALLFLTGT